MNNRSASSALLLLLLLGMACGKSDSHQPDNETGKVIAEGSLSIVPVNLAAVAGIVPLGNLNPPGHTFPTKHMYIYFKTPGTAVDVLSPGRLHIFQLARFKRLSDGYEDYRIECGDPEGTVMFFGHLSSIAAEILSQAGDFTGAVCETYTTGSVTMEYCRKPVSLYVNAGDVIAIANADPEQFNIDLGFSNAGEFSCPLACFNSSARASMEPKIGNASGFTQRMETPLCGEYNLDIPGSLQGNWYKQGAPRSPEDQHIAFVKDNLFPRQLRISIGSGVPGMAAGVYSIGIPDITDEGREDGLMDRKFSGVTNDGITYCYVPRNAAGGELINTSFIVKLENNNTLSFEKRNCNCSCTPYNFTSAKITYTR